MSSGLMSCVRENSPPLELELDASADGPLSLPEGNISRSHGGPRSGPGPATSTPISSPGNDGHEPANAEQQLQQQQQQQKRRRFHPLRNLRRIFRRRTINSSADSPTASQSPTTPGPGPGSCNTLPPPVSSSSEKNLRSVTAPASSAIASSPTSPQNHQSLGESYQTQSLPKSKSYGSHRDELLSVLLGKKRASKQAQHSDQQQQQQQQQQFPADAMYQTHRQQMGVGVAVFPETRSLSRSSYFSEQRHQQRHLRSVGDSSQELGVEREGNSNASTDSGGATADISDSQRSLSEGRLLDVDGDYSRETLSQSHDSVFSESATASSLSIVLKAELTDVLRKRRNRPDASDEDLGLPRSPASPQRRVAGGQSQSRGAAPGHSQLRGHSQSEVSSLSLQSVNSAEETEDSQSNGHSHSHSQSQSQSHRYHSRVSTSSSVSMGSDILRPHHEDEVDAVGTERHRLSHAAAKHKMAIRPAKKKGPSRQHRRTLESSIPEANEDLQKTCPALRAVRDADLKSRTRSLPPKALPAIVSSPSPSTTTITAANCSSSSSSSSSSITTKRTKTIEQATRTTTSSSTSQIFGLRSPTTTTATTINKANTVLESRGESSTDGDDALAASESAESGLLRRLIHRNSKRSIARANDGLEDTDSSQSVAKKLQISSSCLDAAFRESLPIPDKSRTATSHQQHVEHVQETRQMIKREIHNEASHSHGHGRNAIVSDLGVGIGLGLGTTAQPQMASKPKSGPAARQRYIPQELGASAPAATLSSSHSNDVTNLLSKSTRGNDTFQSTTLVREQQVKAETTDRAHFERKPRIVGLSAFQQKLSRSSDSMGHNSSSSNSLETSTDEPSPLYYEEKQRKTVEKSRSFRNYQEERESVVESTVVHNHMPSLPDLSISFRLPSYYKQPSPRSPPQSPRSPLSPNTKCVSLGFEINDNKLLQGRAESAGQLPALAKISPQRSNKLLVQSSPGPANISQIEQNIDMIVKSPLVSVLRKSAAATVSEQLPVEQTAPTAKLQPERPKLLDLGKKNMTSTAMAICSPSPASPLSKSAKLSHSPPRTPAKSSSSNHSNNNNSCGSSRRNSSNVESPAEPEFMKIQLNRVDQASLHKKCNHLVLAKNLKSPSERSQSNDDLSSRRSSGASVEVVEQTGIPVGPSAVPLNLRQALEPNLGRQLRSVSASSVRTSFGSSSGSSEGLSSANTPATTPSTPKSNGIPVPKLEAAPREQRSSQKESKVNRLSLEERKRLFLNEERTERPAVEQRKQSVGKAETPPAVSAPAPATPPKTPELTEVNGNANPVVLRKKSFASCNGNPSPNKDDPTPELMKVFARRSLKVKDEEVVAPSQSVSKKISAPSGSQSVDSDKENQSNSEEKLDKLSPKYEAQISGEFTKTASQHPSNNRNSVDFRNLNTSSNHNNNNISSNLQKAVNGQQSVVTYLPPIKVSNGVRNSNNNGGAKPASDRMSLQMKQTTPSTGSVPAVPQATPPTTGSVTQATGAMSMSGKPIERSATVGEFKGIHQRRAEWEQRAKEALK
ncbi:serine-rich adhesin for platelets isoform X1 [Drosophila subobscura]|uniref:serine-rich adhesin for platelets isoform X1 n=1 Tax=Drosophila subobscura TaxID=7241 RepID=UPI00155ABEFF|nr:serine-rich adhesin for platelets isoform X1 [Drosophila subobscura]